MSKVAATPRELEMLQGLWAGLPNKGIAARMKVSIKTVEAHRHSLNRKLNVHNTAGLLRESLKRKWLDVTA